MRFKTRMILIHKSLRRIINKDQISQGLNNIPMYIQEWEEYSRLAKSDRLDPRDAYPCLHDRSTYTSLDPHYFYQDTWAFNKLNQLKPDLHVDVGSSVSFVGFLAAITRVIFVDIRPVRTNLKNLLPMSGNILAMPFKDGSVLSLSCLHVAEHIGLGRYGDPLDPQGTKKAARELVRVLAPQGHLFFSIPVGKPRLRFNAMRIHSPKQVLDCFADLELVDFAGVDDKGYFQADIHPLDLAEMRYGCGMFHFIKAS